MGPMGEEGELTSQAEHRPPFFLFFFFFGFGRQDALLPGALGIVVAPDWPDR